MATPISDAIITSALRKLRVINAAETAPTVDLATGLEAMNAMLKAWQTRFTIWVDSEVCLFLAKDAQTYTLGPSGSPCCLLSEVAAAQLSVNAAAGATALTVDDNTGTDSGDAVGVQLDDGTLFWTSQNGAVSGTTDITLSTGVTTAASAGNSVFTYSSQIARPIEIIEARLRDTTDSDSPLIVHEGRREFMEITDKTSSGDATDILLLPTTTNATAYVWPVADDVSNRIVMTVRRTIGDFSSSLDFDGPPESKEAIIYNLALRLASEYDKEVTQTVAAMAKSTLDELVNFYRNREPVYLTPNR